ncbi:MAG: hypothetical protein ACR2MP_00830 [Streptosporangiaceae bacterium]
MRNSPAGRQPRQDSGLMEAGRFHRPLGALPATAVNVTQLCGIGPFITIAAMGGPQAIIGWVTRTTQAPGEQREAA